MDKGSGRSLVFYPYSRLRTAAISAGVVFIFSHSPSLAKNAESALPDSNSVHSSADSTHSDKPIVELDRMVVTASKSAMSADMVVENVEVITQEDVQQSGVSDIMELFDGLPGVDIDPNRTQTNIVVNGMSGRYVKILVDGIPVTGDVGGGFPLENLMLGSAERIEVMSGASSTMYGTDAIGGVVNIITKGSSNNTPLGIRTNIHYLNNDSIGVWLGKMRYDLNLLHSNEIFRVKAFGGFDADPVGLVDKYTEKGRGYLRLNYRYPKSGAGKGGVRIDIHPSDLYSLSIDGSVNKSSSASSPEGYYIEGTEIQSIRRRLNISGEMSPADGITAEAYASARAFNHCHTNVVHASGSRESSKTDFLDFEGEMRIHANDKIPFGNRSNVIAGVNVLREAIVSDNLSSDVSRVVGGVFGGTTWESGGLLPVVINPSLRLAVCQNADKGAKDLILADASPKLGVKVNRFGSDNLSVSVEYGQAFTSPPLKKMYYSFNMGGSRWIEGNRTLSPEKAHSFGATATVGENRSTSLSCTGFYTRIDNRIVSEWVRDLSGEIRRRTTDGVIDPDGPLLEQSYRNSAWGFKRGFTVRFKAQPIGWLNIAADLNHVTSMSEDEAGGKLVEDDNYTPNSISLTTRIRFSKILTPFPDLRVQVQWNDRSKDYHEEAYLPRETDDGAPYSDTAYVSFYEESYTKIGLSLHKQFSNALKLKIGANNLLGHIRRGHSGLSYGRVYYVSIHFDIPNIKNSKDLMTFH